MRIAPDPAALDAFVRGERKTFAIALAVVVPIIVGIELVEYRLALVCIALAALPMVPLSVAHAARKPVGPGGAVGLACGEDGVVLTLQRAGAAPTVEHLPWSVLHGLAIHERALEIHVRGERLVRRIFVAGETDAVYGLAHVLSGRGVAVRKADGVLGVGLVLLLAFGYLLGPGLLLLGIVLLVEAAMHPAHGAFFRAGLVLVGCLVVAALVISLRRRRAAAASRAAK